MTTNQIYALLNSINDEAFGTQTTLQVNDVSDLVSLGNTVLSSSTNTEAFLNTLAQRIGRTILRFRDYRNRLGDMVINDFEYGAILQKIKVMMPEAESDPSYGLTDGNSVDPWVVRKPVVDQKLFVTRTPYMFAVTVQREHLKEAFLSESAMGGFISLIFGEVRNAIEASLENLGRATLANLIAESYTGGKEIKLVTDFNAEYSPSTPVTAATALNDDTFLRYSISRINSLIDSLQDISVSYNVQGIETFTPIDRLKIRVISPFIRRLETVTQYAAFHDTYVTPAAAFTKINFWQNSSQPYDVSVKEASDGATTTVENVIALVHDADAAGIYKIDEVVATTPLNARGLYYNTVYHEKQLWFNDLSENAMIFTLN